MSELLILPEGMKISRVAVPHVPESAAWLESLRVETLSPVVGDMRTWMMSLYPRRFLRVAGLIPFRDRKPRGMRRHIRHVKAAERRR